MKAPFSYFGGKSRAVDLVWHAFGAECLNYVEPFFGSGSMQKSRAGGYGARALQSVTDGALAMVRGGWMNRALS